MAYNGWKNYETWCVKLWLDNEQGTQEYMFERAREVWDESEPSPGSVLTREESARYEFAEWLKDEIREIYNLPAEGLAGDLIGAALSEVDWSEIAEAYLEDAREGY